MYNKITDLENNLQGSTVCIRIDANVPIVDGKITDDTRLIEALPSIKFLLENGAKQIFILSHFGRPKAPERKPEFSLNQIVKHLSFLLKEEVEFIENFTQKATKRIALFENLRYEPEEEKGGEELAKTLANMADFYVNDAFSCSHRAHASISVVSKFTKVYAGFLMLKEIENIESIIKNKTGKVLSIVGGSKVSTKITLLKNLITKMDYIFIAGGMANTFLHAQGFEIGASLCEKDLKPLALEILKEAEEKNCKIILPIDVIVTKKIEKFADCEMVSIKNIKQSDIIVDAGSASILELEKLLKECDLFVWNGPLGIFEIPPFGVSTFAFARTVAVQTKQGKLKSIVGGGDTASAILESGFKNQMTYISTAGGAFLEWLEGKSLPGVEALK